METLLQDLRYTVATMRRNLGFSAACLSTLALGIGATTAVVSIVYGVLLRPLPYPEGDRLVRLWEEHPGGVSPAGNRWLSNHTYYAWLEQTRTLDGIGAYATYEYTVTFGDERQRLVGSAVSPIVFTLLGARPGVGRFFTPREGEEGANRVVVLSDRFFRDQYGADTSILGRFVTINEQPHTIVGVASPELRFPDDRVQFWLPNVVPHPTDGATRPFTALGRLRAGVTFAQAEAEGTVVARSVTRLPMSTELFFGKGGPVVVHARPLRDDITASVRPALLVMAAAVTLVLFMACANVANLFLSRGIARQREMAIRAAIGGSRARLVRQLVTESAVLSLTGGWLGLAIAAAMTRIVPMLAPARFPRLDDIEVDWAMVTIAALASLFTTAASGLVPAFRASRFDLVTSMRGGYEASSGGFRRLRTRQLRHAVLVLQSVFAVILLVGAGLLARSFARLLDVDAGYRPDHVLTARVRLPQSATSGRMATLIEHVLTRLRAMPGVSAAGAGNMMPLLNVTAITTFSVPATPGGPPMMARAVTYVVTPGYAEALGLRLRQGRFFTHADTRRDARKMLVNEEFVRQYMSGPVVGRHLGDLYTGEKGTTTEIVGVVGNLLKDGNDRQPQPEVYFLDRSSTLRIEGALSIVVRTTGDPAILAPALRSMLREADRAAVAEQIAPLRDLVARSVDQPRFAMIVLVTFAALAVLLASVGLYGVLSYSVAQRRRELGIRAAIGADRSALMGLILREGLTITFLGGAIGLVVAAWLTQFMRSMLFGVLPVDTIAFAGASLILFAVATLACLQPAIRAARTDPTLALRAE